MPRPTKPSRHATREHLLRTVTDPQQSADRATPSLFAPASELPSLLAARRARSAAPRGVREAWVQWLAPHFATNDAAYFTGTYSDEYGFANGLMLVRNVVKDWERYLAAIGYQGKYIIGVEQHAFRDVLHLHGILAGPFDASGRAWLKAWWAAERGHARVLPVLDGCASYVTKYALKGDTDAFEWNLT